VITTIVAWICGCRPATLPVSWQPTMEIPSTNRRAEIVMGFEFVFRVKNDRIHSSPPIKLHLKVTKAKFCQPPCCSSVAVLSARLCAPREGRSVLRVVTRHISISLWSNFFYCVSTGVRRAEGCDVTEGVPEQEGGGGSISRTRRGFVMNKQSFSVSGITAAWKALQTAQG